MFESLIDKPKMLEKYLAKPPFKYIFDMISETSKKTNFAQGKLIYMQDSMKVINLNLTIMEKKPERLIISLKLSHWLKQCREKSVQLILKR